MLRIALPPFLLIGACGGGSSDARALGELSQSELDSLCDELHGYAVRTWNGACTQEGVEGEDDGRGSCDALREQCLKESAGGCNAMKAVASGASECKNVQVGDLRDCLMSSAALAEHNYGAGVDCSTGLQPAAHPSSELPKSCQRILDGCAELASEMGPADESSSAMPESGICPDATTVSSALGMNLVQKPMLGEQVCTYGTDADHTQVSIEYLQDVNADEFVFMWTMRTPATPLSGIGDRAFYTSSMPGAPTATMLNVLQGTTSISIAAPKDLETVEGLMRTLLARL